MSPPRLLCLCLLAPLLLATEPPPDTTCEDKAAYGFIDKQGHVAIPPQFRAAFEFRGGLAAVETKDRKLGYIDKTGKFVLPAKYEVAGAFADGLACVREAGTDKIIDKTGATRIPDARDCHEFHDGLAEMSRGGVPGVYDETGKLAFKTEGDQLGDFASGVAPYLRGTGDAQIDGYVTKAGKRIPIPKSGGTYAFSEGLGRVAVRAGKDKYLMGFVDPTGNLVIKPTLEGAADFHEGLAGIQKGGRWGFMDKTGKVVIPPRFASDVFGVSVPYELTGGPEFHGGRALVFEGNGKAALMGGGDGGLKALFIDRTGAVKVRLKPGVIAAHNFADGLAYVVWESHQAFVNDTGREVIDASRFYRVDDFSEGLAAACITR